MSIITILLFIAYTLGLGYSGSFFVKEKGNIYEKWVMRVGIGLGALPLLLVLMNLFRIPLYWWLVLILCLVLPAVMIIRYRSIKMPSLTFNKSTIYFGLVLVIFLLTLFMYAKGAFNYPYFEDYDPWVHAVGAKYVAVEKNFDDTGNNIVYLRPYPPGYDGIMGVLHQTSSSLMWTMKFFNALIISLGILFFFFFAKNFMGSSEKGLFATIVLAMIPAYLSHFVWAHALAMSLLMVALYCLVMIEKDKRWIYPSIIVISGICLSQPSKPIKFMVLFMAFVLVKSIISRKFTLAEFSAVIGGYALSVIWWASNFKTMFVGRFAASGSSAGAVGIFTKVLSALKKAFPNWSGSGTRPYTFSDFFVAKSQNMINNPIGIGVVISLLFVFSLVVLFLTYRSASKEKKTWFLTSIIWFIFTFLLVNSLTFNLPFGFYGFRVWMLLAIPISIIVAEGFWFITNLLKQVGVPKVASILVLVLLLFFTSGKQKYDVNTAVWPSGADFTYYEDSMDNSWLRANLPADTKVFAYTGDEKMIGFDMYSCLWCKDVIDFRNNLLYTNVTDLYSWLKSRKYEYLTIDSTSVKTIGYTFGENETQQMLPVRFGEISSFGGFRPVYSTERTAIFRII